MDIDCPLHHFGHLAYWDDKDRLRYCDNDELAAWPSERPCAKCGELPTRWGQDPCIADLPGVRDACCGHGLGGYIAFEDGRMILFPVAEIEDRRPTDARWAAFGHDALAQMGREVLKALLREAPRTGEPEELAIRLACWAALAG